ncbi:MAG: metalloregulator ArsR/SmtB family transcription factor [Clostridiaceae bacterium]|nr:metalloregulator ArsR/SmtB family transcription factor [Clostridiaceae bacterium]
MNDAYCTKFDTHPERIRGAAYAMPDGQDLQEAGELFKVLGDPTRMQMISALLTNELCVCDLSELLGMSQSAISHQLRILRQARLVRYRREGKNAFYRLADSHIQLIVQLAIEHSREIYKDIPGKDRDLQNDSYDDATTLL